MAWCATSAGADSGQLPDAMPRAPTRSPARAPHALPCPPPAHARAHFRSPEENPFSSFQPSSPSDPGITQRCPGRNRNLPPCVHDPRPGLRRLTLLLGFLGPSEGPRAGEEGHTVKGAPACRHGPPAAHPAAGRRGAEAPRRLLSRELPQPRERLASAPCGLEPLPPRPVSTLSETI